MFNYERAFSEVDNWTESSLVEIARVNIERLEVEKRIADSLAKIAERMQHPMLTCEPLRPDVHNDITHSLSVIAEGFKPPRIELHKPSKARVFLLCDEFHYGDNRGVANASSWIQIRGDRGAEQFYVIETPDEITAKIKEALESANEEAATPDSATASNETKND